MYADCPEQCVRTGRGGGRVGDGLAGTVSDEISWRQLDYARSLNPSISESRGERAGGLAFEDESADQYEDA